MALVLALLLTALAAALRLYHLDGRSLWLDEVVTAHSLRFSSLPALLAYARTWTDITPGIFVLTWLGRGLGNSEVAVRLPYALAGIANVFVLYWLGRVLARSRVGLLAAGLLAVLPFAVWYSQEARPYAFLMLFTTAQMLCAYQAVRRGRPAYWVGFVLCSILNLYMGFVALAPTGAAIVFIALTLALEALTVGQTRPPGGAPPPRPLLLQSGWAMGSVLAIALGFWPLVPQLQEFLARGDLGFGRLQPAPLTGGAVLDQLGNANFTPLLLLLAGGGLLLLLAGLRGERRVASLLLLLWLGVPLAFFAWRAGSGILLLPVRYLSFLYPAAVLLVALGVEAVAIGAGWLARRVARGKGMARQLPWPIYSLAILLILAQMVPALAVWSTLPKDDYRGVAAYVATHSPPGSVVLGMRLYNALFVPESVGYYFWQQQVPMIALDGRKLDFGTAQRLKAGTAHVWGMVYRALDADHIAQARTAGLEVIPFSGLTLLRVAAPEPLPLEQARTLLQWGSRLEPALATSLAILDAAQTPTGGPNLLPLLSTAAPPVEGVALLGGHEPLEQWVLWAGTASAEAGAVRLTPGGGEVNVTLLSGQPRPDGRYVLRFRYRNGALAGAQRVYVSAHSADGRWLTTFPDGGGYLCDPSPDWAEQAFAVTLPPETATVRVWLRASGSGQAEFAAVELRPAP